MDKIERFLGSLQGDERDVAKCLEFLLDLQRKSTPDSPAPVIEIVSILKVEHAKLFDRLKQRAINYRSLQLLMEIPIDYNTAKKRLGMDR